MKLKFWDTVWTIAALWFFVHYVDTIQEIMRYVHSR